jgi:xylan 1,4-beta-xylosidase
MGKVKNPILPGFNPDPSILRVEKDYYIATSTFEWFPGVLIYHSKDLANWKLISKPLNRVSQLNMIGNPSSCGIWAPYRFPFPPSPLLKSPVQTSLFAPAGCFKSA